MIYPISYRTAASATLIGIFFNVLNPNGDQVNDVFAIAFGSDITVHSLDGAVYDRWGDEVYSRILVVYSTGGNGIGRC